MKTAFLLLMLIARPADAGLSPRKFFSGVLLCASALAVSSLGTVAADEPPSETLETPISQPDFLRLEENRADWAARFNEVVQKTANISVDPSPPRDGDAWPKKDLLFALFFDSLNMPAYNGPPYGRAELASWMQRNKHFAQIFTDEVNSKLNPEPEKRAILNTSLSEVFITTHQSSSALQEKMVQFFEDNLRYRDVPKIFFVSDGYRMGNSNLKRQAAAILYSYSGKIEYSRLQLNTSVVHLAGGNNDQCLFRTAAEVVENLFGNGKNRITLIVHASMTYMDNTSNGLNDPRDPPVTFARHALNLLHTQMVPIPDAIAEYDLKPYSPTERKVSDIAQDLGINGRELLLQQSVLNYTQFIRKSDRKIVDVFYVEH